MNKNSYESDEIKCDMELIDKKTKTFRMENNIFSNIFIISPIAKIGEYESDARMVGFTFTPKMYESYYLKCTYKEFLNVYISYFKDASKNTSLLDKLI